MPTVEPRHRPRNVWAGQPSHQDGKLVPPPATPLTPPAGVVAFGWFPGEVDNFKEESDGAGAEIGIGSSSYSLAK